MKNIQTTVVHKRKYICPTISFVVIETVSILSGSDSIPIKPSGHGDADKAMIGSYNPNWIVNDEEEDD